jgi:hypothetical protein
MVESATNWIEEELRFAKSAARNEECAWGRRVILAIAKDDPAALMSTFQANLRHSTIKKDSTPAKNSGSPNVDEQCQLTGYANFMWTPLMHRFLGDTALHLAIKQKKIGCVSALLALGASTSISNASGDTPESLSLRYYNKSIANLEFEALRTLFTKMRPKDFNSMPDFTNNRSRTSSHFSLNYLNHLCLGTSREKRGN